MKQNNRTCVCCSTKYTYCNTCETHKEEPAWKAMWCSENCKTIFMAVTDFLAKEISLQEAKQILEQCDLSHQNKFGKSITDTIDAICSEKSSKKKQKDVI